MHLPPGNKCHIFSVTFWGVKCLEAGESALIRVVAPKDHWHEVPSRQDGRVSRGALIVLRLLATESQGFVPLGQNLVGGGRGPLEFASHRLQHTMWSVVLQRVPGCSHIHKGVRVPSWSGGSRAWPCDHLGRWCSTGRAGRPGTAGGSWGRWSCRTGPSFPHSGTRGGGRTGQTGNTNWRNTEGVMAAVFKGLFRKNKWWDSPGHAGQTVRQVFFALGKH